VSKKKKRGGFGVLGEFAKWGGRVGGKNEGRGTKSKRLGAYEIKVQKTPKGGAGRGREGRKGWAAAEVSETTETYAGAELWRKKSGGLGIEENNSRKRREGGKVPVTLRKK